MKLRTASHSALAAVALTLAASAPAQEKYLSGGSKPFSREVQTVLDQHAGILTLGINSDWLATANIDPAHFVAALDAIAQAVAEERIPGAQLYVNRITNRSADLMPIGIGYRMTDPQKHAVHHDTMYWIDDLQGPLLTVPLALSMITAGQLRLDGTAGELLPALAGTEIAPITVRMLLSHSSGLPKTYYPEPAPKDREQALKALATMPLAGKPGEKVEKSPLNFLLLGLIVEELQGARLSEVADQWQIFGEGRQIFENMDTRRQFIAPNNYDKWLGRLAWAEPSEPFGQALYPNAGHTGVVGSSDALGAVASQLLLIRSLSVSNGKAMSDLGRAFLPTEGVEGGSSMGLGYELGRFGQGSFGWDSPRGCSLWVIPQRDAFVVYLSNHDHPNGVPADFVDPREKVFTLLDKALRELPSPAVDTRAAASEPVTVNPTPEK
jgi:CubicO group peptidase (beta-lactamase class C family)